MGVGFAAARLGELCEQVLDILGARPVRHEHRIRGFHDHQVLHAQRGHQALRGMQVAALGVQGHHVAHHGVALLVFRGHLVEGFPRAQVVPVGRKRHDTRPLRMLHDGVIDGIRRGSGKRRGVDPDEIQVPGAGGPGLVAGGMDGRRKACELVQVDRGPEQEDTAVPGEATVGQEPLGLCVSGLLDEPVHPEDTGGGRGPAADVAVARLRPRGGHTEGHQRAVPGNGGRCGRRRVERCVRLNDVVGGQHQEQRVLARLPGGESRQGNGRRRVARLGLEQNVGRNPQILEDAGREEAVLLVADHQWLSRSGQVRCAFHRLPEQSPRREFDELLGVELARQRPQPRAAAPA